MKFRAFVLIFTAFLLHGCATLPEAILDETEIRQNHTVLIEEKKIAHNFLLAPEVQAKMDRDYNVIYFSVWHNQEPVHALPERITQIFKKFSYNLGYGENKRKHTSAWIKKLQKNAAIETYPNALYRAITTRPTNLRMLPTNGPHFYKPGGDIEGWPFDNLQISSVAANTPLLVCHVSEDRSWALVETNFAFGWIPIEDFARVDENFIIQWERGMYVVAIQDKTSIFDTDGKFSIRTSVGQIFPLVHENQEDLEIFIATTDENKNAVVKRSRVSRNIVSPKPLPFTYANAVTLANEFIDEPYGWGGLYGNRDCSAMTRDFFAPFGIWLPRHSADQAKKVGTYIDLANLQPQEKEKMILEKGLPYLSLLWCKGHIMLYIGARDGRPLIFHNIWGLKTRKFTGKEGRKIIGKAVITSLYPGTELYNLDPKDGLLINKISALTIVAPGEPPIKTEQNNIVSFKHKEANTI